MVVQDIYQDNILSYVVPYLLRNNNGYKLKNNIGSFTHIDNSIKLFDRDNVLRFTYPKIDKQTIYQNILDNPAKYYNLDYIRKKIEPDVTQKDTFQKASPMIPVLAAGIGYLQSNPFIIIIIIIVIMIIFLLFRSLSQKSEYGTVRRRKKRS
jgi:hypothetical protein